MSEKRGVPKNTLIIWHPVVHSISAGRIIPYISLAVSCRICLGLNFGSGAGCNLNLHLKEGWGRQSIEKHWRLAWSWVGWVPMIKSAFARTKKDRLKERATSLRCRHLMPKGNNGAVWCTNRTTVAFSAKKAMANFKQSGHCPQGCPVFGWVQNSN